MNIIVKQRIAFSTSYSMTDVVVVGLSFIQICVYRAGLGVSIVSYDEIEFILAHVLGALTYNQ